jgi:EAL domain-containing protein (putative c-di-GMP-specific phosphodiesterase class I)
MSIAELVVMVVEDHGFQRKIALKLLDDLGIRTVFEAADGRTALDVLGRADVAPDVVLVDLDLPKMDGIELIGHIAQRKLSRAVAVTSALEPAILNTVQSMARAYGLRVLGTIEKPLTGPKLADLLSLYRQDEPVEHDVLGVHVSADTLRAALEADAFEPWFQPKAEIGNGHIVGVEALVRWRHSDEMVLPVHFIGLLEREGLIDPLTERVLAKACAWRQRWAQAGRELKIAVNVSMLSLARVESADRYQEIVTLAGCSPRDVVLEVTESSVMSEAAHSLNVLARLRLKGFGLSIDDFGTGYSSLAQLSQIPFTELKIDQGFIAGAPGNARKRAVVEASLDLARKLDLSSVAEGVETVDEWQMLAELGCRHAQGYLVSRPVAGEDLLDAIAHWRRPHTLVSG